MTTADFKSLLSKLVNSPSTYTPKDLEGSLSCLFSGNQPDPAQIGAFLLAVHVNHIERQPGCLASAAKVLRDRSTKTEVEASEDFIVDVVGTGGDGHDTFNVSTSAAIVAAGAGARVMKHGARAATSSSGSADLLQSLGIQFASPTSSSILPKIPFTFLLAPLYHPALASIAPIRRSLPFRTIFNLLGPLINPAKPKGMILGVPDRVLGHVFAHALKESGTVRRAMVVCGAEGLDEISCAGITYVWSLSEDGSIREGTLHPTEDFGLPIHPLSDVKSSTPAENAKTLERLLTSGSVSTSSPVTDFILLNASALLVVAGVAKDYKHGVGLARKSIRNGKAWDAVQNFKIQQERQEKSPDATDRSPKAVLDPHSHGMGQAEFEQTKGFGWLDR